MPLETIYYVGQTVAVVAILMSLIFVAYQTRQTSRLARMELTRSLLAEARYFGDTLATSSEMSKFIFDSRNATETLQPREFFGLAMYYASWFTTVESAFRIHKQNLMDHGVYEHIRVTTKVMDCVNMRTWWQMAKSSYPADFAYDVDQALAEWDQSAESS